MTFTRNAEDLIATVKTVFDGESASGGAADRDSGALAALDPVASWRMDERSSGTAPDASRTDTDETDQSGTDKNESPFAKQDAFFVSAFTEGVGGGVGKTPGSKLTYSPPAGDTGPDSPADSPADSPLDPAPDTETQAGTPTTSDAGTLHVGPGHPFGSLGEAVAASKPGDTIVLEAGTYASDYSTIGHALTIKGVGGLAHLKAVDPIPNGKAILVTRADVTLENIKFSGASVPDRNGAGIRHESGDLVIRGSIFENNENGILSAPDATATVTIRNSEFIGNGYGDGRSHGIYVNQIASLDIEGSTFRDTSVGHHIKSRAHETTVRDSTIDDGQGDSSYSVDLPNGGRAILEGNTLIQTALAGNTTMVAYGAEGNLHSQNSLLVKDNLFIDHHPHGKGVYNHTDIVVTLQGNTFQDVETEVVGPHAFVDAGAPDANPAADDSTIPADEAASDGSDSSAETPETPTEIPDEGAIPDDLFSNPRTDGSQGIANDPTEVIVDIRDCGDAAGSDAGAGDWWFGPC
jgi:hypothetical protein